MSRCGFSERRGARRRRGVLARLARVRWRLRREMTDSSGDDELLERLRAEAPPPRVRAPVARVAPASEEVVAAVERAAGGPLDSFLRRVYREVADGGIGPGYASLPLAGDESVLSTYAAFRSAGPAAGDWPEGLLPIWDWGCATWSCVDPAGSVVTSDQGRLTLTPFNVRSWLRAWLEGVDLWSEIYEDERATILDPFTRRPVLTKKGAARGRPWPGSRR